MSESLFTRAQLRAAGLTDRQVDSRLASGALIAARRGILQFAPDPAPPDPLGAEPLAAPARRSVGSVGSGEPKSGVSDLAVPVEIRAALLASPSRDLVVSHSTAARLFQLPRPLAGWPLPHFIAASGPNRRRSGVQITVSALTADEIVIQHGVAVTSPDRTVADCLRTLPGRDALAIADAALRRRLVRTEAVTEVLRAQTGWPGVAVARQVLALTNFRRESPLESWSAWAFAHTGVIPPEWQIEVREPGGVLVGRADCWWSDGVIGEADGRSKYALAAAERGGGTDAVFEVLQAERRREQRLRDFGADVIRWTTGDVLKESLARRLAQRIAGAIALAQEGPRFTGIVAPAKLLSATD